MKILFATAELAPLARVGGLAEAAAGLVVALRDADVEVDVVLPDYGDVELEGQHEVFVSVPEWVGDTRVRRGRHRDVGLLTLVAVPGMARPHPYVDADGEGWVDNDHRFFSFAAVVAALADGEQPDVLHLNDWHTAAATAFVATSVPTVLTVHTLGYQGTTGPQWLGRLPNDPWRFAWYGGTNPLAGAIELVDRVIAVSPNYAAEIITPDAGMGLHERLGALGDRLVGIRNGVDTAIWDPGTDPHIAATYSVVDPAGRIECRRALADEAGWPDDKQPIIGLVTRLVEQKGIDILLDVVPFLRTMPARLAILGSGPPHLADRVQAAAVAAPDRVWFTDGYDTGLGHRIFAGSDLFAMPSRFEPCGLGQMQAMAYGALPVVTDVGGLHDTVVDADDDRAAGTGFVSRSVDAAGFVDALHRAVRAVKQPARRTAIQRRGMAEDWSWTVPGAAHIDLYRALAER
ncbi:MAG: glycogen/starch synthase [Acidimicrobiia bacterium]|nr:glycogen/starch synthase [Acidimicrobiia bacterium]